MCLSIKLASTKHAVLLFACIMLAGIAFSQTANVTGKVLAESTNEEVVSATIQVKGTGLSTISDNHGNYELKNVPAGKAEIEVSSVSFESRTFLMDVTPGQVLVLNVILSTKSKELESVVVSTRRSTGSQTAVVLEIKNAKSVVSGISKQQIALSQDDNAAQVMQRVPGVTIVENRFIMIRGLSERYNNVLINNVVAPSTEVDKRTFSFDLIPSGSLDRMIIHKSGSPENPGDFAGGVIKVFTNNIVEKPFTQLTIGTGYRSNTTGRDYMQSEGSATDILGFDNGYRSLPGRFPTTESMLNSSRNSQLRKDAAALLPNNFVAQRSAAIPDIHIGFGMGRRFKIGRYNVSNVTSVNYSQTYQYMNRDFYRYFEYDPARPGQLDKRFEFLDDVYDKTNKINIMSNWSLSINPRNKIKFSNLFNQIGENETSIRQGEDFIQTLGWRRHYMLAYRSRSIYTGQLEGAHDVGDRHKINWVLGFSSLNEREPDLRRFRTYAPEGTDNSKLENYRMITPPSSNLFDASRFFGKLSEYSFNNGLDYTFNFNGGTDQEKRELKLGYYVDYRSRDFSSRYVSYLIPGSVPPDRKAELEALPLSEIFSRENVTSNDGFVLEEGTRPQDSYTASNFLSAGYASIVYPINNFTFSGGVRAEYNIQSLNSFQGLRPVEVNNPILSILPFANAVWSMTEKSQLRLGYGRTVNRPEFRELAPFLYYDYKLDANRVGNPDLVTAVIDNIDLRYEFYPRYGESISVGAFFKYFNDPIENRNIITSELPQFTYINADYAYNYGVEVEIRKSLDKIFGSAFLQKLAVNVNAAYIYSVVDLGRQASAQRSIRQLQGQSPYIVNAILSYNDLPSKVMAAVSYNIFGTRIFAVGDLNNPDIYELPRHSLDITLTKTFSRFSVKAGIQDVLNYRYRFYQDTDRNAKANDAIDRPIFTFQRGTLFNLAFTINL